MRQHDVPAGCKLTRTGPGLYVDETGAEYFYLTGMYPCVAQHLAQHRLLNTSAVVVEILGEIRISLHELCQMELLD